MNKKLLAIAMASMFIAPVAYADKHGHKAAIDNCVKAAQAKFPGKLTSVRAEIEDGKSQYEIDIAGNDGKFYEAECDAKTGKITETEREVAADDPEFTSKAKVSLETALATALAKYPGAVIKIEYEVEPDGIAYEFDIKTADGKVLEVEVDAITGKLGDPEEVLYQIGE
ncbi:hypothetical protein MTYP_01309 [Methylophilaceae bacterium]|nr:hypothetical protein MTYP_01309 [Methylophilaceae bacterium]